jgi:hypothetical protein
MRLRLALGSLLLASCLAKVKPVRMPDGQEALRIECNYDFANCERKARRECDGDYERVTQGNMSCKDCGTDWPSHDAFRPKPEGNNVYKGVLYVRCR